MGAPITIELGALRGAAVEEESSAAVPAVAAQVAEAVGTGPSALKLAVGVALGVMLYRALKGAVGPTRLGAAGTSEWVMIIPPLHRVKRMRARVVPVRDLHTALRFAQVHARQTGEVITVKNTRTGQTEVVGPE